MENYFLIGDVHGCYYTFKKLLESADLQKDLIIQVGDIIDRGNFSDKCIDLAIDLELNYQAVFLLGNHEYECLLHFDEKYNSNWLKQGGIESLQQISKSDKGLSYYINWLRNRKLIFENEQLFVSHAGISESPNPMDLKNRQGILWNRQSIKNIEKVQIFGHTPSTLNVPTFIKECNAWNVDTGAYKGNGLSALYLNKKGEKLDAFFVPTDPRDISM